MARALLRRGHRVVALTRRPDGAAAEALRRQGAQPVYADLDQPDSLEGPLSKARAVFGVTEYWEHGLEKEVAQGRRLIDAAVRARVDHFVFSSVGGIDRTEGRSIWLADSKRAIEDHLQRSGLHYSILRPVTFFENFVSPRYRRAICHRGVFWFAIEPHKPFQMIAMDDLAAFAAMALEGHAAFAKSAVEVASDRLTMVQFADVLARAVGRPVRYAQLSMLQVALIALYVEGTRSRGHFKTGWSLVSLFRWMNESPTGGWNADLDVLASVHPNLLNARAWAERVAWHDVGERT